MVMVKVKKAKILWLKKYSALLQCIGNMQCSAVHCTVVQYSSSGGIIWNQNNKMDNLSPI